MAELTAKMSELKLTEVEKPKYPKNKRNAYNYFSQQIRSDLKAKGESMSVGQSSKLCSQKWKQVSKKEREKYERKAVEDGARFEAEWLEYEEKKAEYDKWVDQQFNDGNLNELPSIHSKPNKKIAAAAKPSVKNSGKLVNSKKLATVANSASNAEPLPQQKPKLKPIPNKKDKEEKEKPKQIADKGKQKQANQKKLVANNKKSVKDLFDETDDNESDDHREDDTMVGDNTFVADGQVNELKYVKNVAAKDKAQPITSEEDSFDDEDEDEVDDNDEDSGDDDTDSFDDSN